MRIIEVSSPSAHDRGRQYGRAAADLIGTAIEYYGRAFELQTGRTWAQILQQSAPWEQLISSEFPGPGWQPERVGELRAAFALTEGRP
jgi:isopenicillin-N N-acyltransferase like protein